MMMTIRSALGAPVALAIAAAITLPAVSTAAPSRNWSEPAKRSCVGDDAGVTKTYPHGTQRGRWVCNDGVWEKAVIYTTAASRYSAEPDPR
jgi:hypothetical protein